MVELRTDGKPTEVNTCVECGKPAEAHISWPERSGQDKEGYGACEMCAWHNEKNRGATFTCLTGG